MYKTSSDYEAMSKAISMRGAGGLAGSILGMHQYHRVQSDYCSMLGHF